MPRPKDIDVGDMVAETCAEFGLASDHGLVTRAVWTDPQAIVRARAHLVDKMAAYGELATPLRNKAGYFCFMLRRELDGDDS